MRVLIFRLAVALVLLFANGAIAQEEGVESRITRVGMFKNGIGLVERRIEVAEDGVYFLHPPPTPIHGTIWMTSDADVSVRKSTRSLPIPLGGPGDPLRGHLVGKELTFILRDAPEESVVGVLEQVLPGTPEEWVVIRGERGRLFVRPSAIWAVRESDTDDFESTREMDQQVLEFEASGVPDGGAAVSFLYLTRGLTWAPSYRLQLSEEKGYSLEQQTLLLNDLEDFEDARVEVITGYPSIAYMNTSSPLSPGVSVVRFLQELSGSQSGATGGINNAASNQAVVFNFDAGGFGGGGGRGGGGGSTSVPPNALTAGDADLHYHALGERSMKRFETVSESLGKKNGKYRERLLWTVVNEREVARLGGPGSFGSGNSSRAVDDSPRLNYPGLWDAVVFENPFDRPLTTAPCMMEMEGRFLGQTLLYWTAPEKEVTLPLTKALGVPADVREEQVRAWRHPETGRNLQEIRVTFTLNNPRASAQEVSLHYYVRGSRINVPDTHDADARILSPESWNDLYLLTATLDVDAESETQLEFTYERAN